MAGPAIVSGAEIALVAAAGAIVVAACSAPESAETSAVQTGGIGVQLRVRECPNIPTYAADPQAAPVGATVRIRAAMGDPVGDHLTFAWTADKGLIVSPKSASTTYLCSEPGEATLSLTASDGTCFDKQSLIVTCRPCPDAGPGSCAKAP
jgi:hypothetical protein